ncbi:MAG: hypothetical protein WAM82_29825 [Thermoanaerobaculia bacterium]
MTLLSERSRWPLVAIQTGASLFIVALVGSALFDPSIWVLHTLQALIYVGVMVLARRGSALGFGAGFTIALLWNSANIFATGFVAAALHSLLTLLRTGQITRPVLLLILVGTAGHFLMIAGCAAGFFRTRPRLRQWAEFLGGAMLGFVALVLISPLRHHKLPLPLDVAPQYDVAPFRARLSGISRVSRE